MNFKGFILLLEQWGVADVLLPFFLIYVIVFAILQKTEILGKGKKNFNSVIALVMGLAVIFPHVLGMQPDIMPVINSALPGVSIVLVGVVMLLLLIGILGGEVRWLGTSISGWIAIISLLIILYIFGRSTGWPGFRHEVPWWLDWLNINKHPDIAAFVIIVLVFGVLIWFITKDDTEKKSNVLTRVTEDIGKMFGGGK